jgi:WD40 repeat protein
LADPPQRQYWTRFDFSNKELVFATGHVNGRVRIWDVYTGNNSTNFVYLICFKIFLLVVLKGRKLLELMDHTQAVRDLAFAPDGSLRLVSASLDRTIKVRSAATFHFVFILKV